jgi:hypothetical protein
MAATSCVGDRVTAYWCPLILSLHDETQLGTTSSANLHVLCPPSLSTGVGDKLLTHFGTIFSGTIFPEDRGCWHLWVHRWLHYHWMCKHLSFFQDFSDASFNKPEAQRWQRAWGMQNENCAELFEDLCVVCCSWKDVLVRLNSDNIPP